MNLFINDLFWTLQGEGLHAGRRALFVRMPYCNLACSWCDTTFNTYRKVSVDELKAFAMSEPARFAVVTGGEPMMHRHTPVVVEVLKDLGFYVAAETNGTFAAPCDFDFVTCSPKRDSEYFIHPDLSISEIKYVVDDEFDFSILDRHANDAARKSLSPEFGAFESNIVRIMAYLQKNPEWRLSLQTHKWIGIP